MEKENKILEKILSEKPSGNNDIIEGLNREYYGEIVRDHITGK